MSDGLNGDRLAGGRLIDARRPASMSSCVREFVARRSLMFALADVPTHAVASCLLDRAISLADLACLSMHVCVLAFLERYAAEGAAHESTSSALDSPCMSIAALIAQHRLFRLCGVVDAHGRNSAMYAVASNRFRPLLWLLMQLHRNHNAQVRFPLSVFFKLALPW